MVHTHHCLLVQKFYIQLQHSANPLLSVNDEKDICNSTVYIILQLKCQLRSLSTYYQLQLHQYPLQVNFNFNIKFHLNIKFNQKWMSDGHLTSMIVKWIFESIYRNSRILQQGESAHVDVSTEATATMWRKQVPLGQDPANPILLTTCFINLRHITPQVRTSVCN